MGLENVRLLILVLIAETILNPGMLYLNIYKTSLPMLKERLERF
jgi:hypothetical protein